MANTQGTTGLLGWIDERFPLTKPIREHLTEYYACLLYTSRCV